MDKLKEDLKNLTQKLNKDKKSLEKLTRQKEDYITKHSIHNFKSEYIGCKNCGSKLKISLISGEQCPLCSNDLRNPDVSAHILDLNVKISALKKDIQVNEVMLYRLKEESTGHWSVDKSLIQTELSKKISGYLNIYYANLFAGAEACVVKDRIVVVSKDYVYDKTRTDRKYDIFVFDLDGNYRGKKLVAFTSPSSDLSIRCVFGKGDNLYIELSSYVKFDDYSKCDDECIGYKIFSIIQNATGEDNVSLVETTPFIFKKRTSERGYSNPYPQKYHFASGDHYVFDRKSMDGHTPEEIALGKKIFRECCQRAGI